MADVKISALPTGTPLAAGDLFPCVKSGSGETEGTEIAELGGITFGTWTTDALTIPNSTGGGDPYDVLFTVDQGTVNVEIVGQAGFSPELSGFGDIVLNDRAGLSAAFTLAPGANGQAAIQVSPGGFKSTGPVVAWNTTPPNAKTTLNAASTDLATVIALTNQIRAMLIALGFAQ